MENATKYVNCSQHTVFCAGIDYYTQQQLDWFSSCWSESTPDSRHLLLWLYHFAIVDWSCWLATKRRLYVLPTHLYVVHRSKTWL